MSERCIKDTDVFTHILSFAHHAKHGPGLADRRQDSSLSPSQPKATRDVLSAKNPPGSNSIRRFAPMRLIPHPPALLLSKKTNSLPSGSLNWSTNFCLFVMLIDRSEEHTSELQSRPHL